MSNCTLPELTLPAGTPAFLADTHSIELTPMYADVQMRTGHDRRRRVYTTVPRVVTVALQLTADQMLAFHTWFEGPLQAGVQWFSAQMANQGPGLLWWKARFFEPYTADASDGGWFKVSAKLLLVCDGSTTGPYTPNMTAGAVVALSGTATLTAPAYLTADATIALLPTSYMSAAAVIALITPQVGSVPSSVDFEKRWIWMRYPYAVGRTADVTDASEFDQRSWFGL